MLTITAANSIFILNLDDPLDLQFQLEGFATDSVVDTDAVETSQTIMGVDGNMSVGFVPYMTKQRIAVMPDSPSSPIMELWMNTQTQQREVIVATSGIITLPSIKRKYICTKGTLSNAKAVPGVKKLLESRDWELTWQSVVSVPML